MVAFAAIKLVCTCNSFSEVARHVLNLLDGLRNGRFRRRAPHDGSLAKRRILANPRKSAEVSVFLELVRNCHENILQQLDGKTGRQVGWQKIDPAHPPPVGSLKCPK